MLLFATLAAISTFMGGLIALKYKDKLHIILGFTAGILLAVVAFDLLPEIFDLTAKLGLAPTYAMSALVIGFLTFHILERTVVFHHEHEDHYGDHKHPVVGMASALALIGHSFLDGVAIGFAFQASASVGIIVAFAVIAHDMADGLNTVSLMLVHENTRKRALLFLFLDALAPVLGATSTMFFVLQEKSLLAYLGFFAGFLLYIGASEILPEAHSKHSSWKTVLATLLGVVVLYIALNFIG